MFARDRETIPPGAFQAEDFGIPRTAGRGDRRSENFTYLRPVAIFAYPNEIRGVCEYSGYEVGRRRRRRRRVLPVAYPRAQVHLRERRRRGGEARGRGRGRGGTRALAAGARARAGALPSFLPTTLSHVPSLFLRSADISGAIFQSDSRPLNV